MSLKNNRFHPLFPESVVFFLGMQKNQENKIQNPNSKTPKRANEGVPNVYTRRNLGWGVGFPPGPLNFSQVPIFRSCDVKLEAVFQLEDSDCKNTFEKYKTRAKHIETHRTRHAIAPYIVGDVFRVAADRHQPVYNPAMPAAN